MPSSPIRIKVAAADHAAATRAAQAEGQALSAWLREQVELAADGRKRPVTSQRRTHAISLRLPPELRQRVELAAERAGIGIVEWIRAVLRSANL